MSVLLLLLGLWCLLYVHVVDAYLSPAILNPRVLQNGRMVKVIAGLHNFQSSYVQRVAEAAIRGGATHLDIACSADLVKEVKALSNLLKSPIGVCVSDIDPDNFVPAVAAGADMIEIGNFDGFYPLNQVFSAQKVIDLTKKTRQLLKSIPLSVTVPHTLSIEDQIALARELQHCGADMIQTEGKQRKDASTSLDRAQSAIISAFVLSKQVEIPVLCSSGLDASTSSLAFQAGAKGVGVGNYVTQFRDDLSRMTSCVREVVRAVNADTLTSTLRIDMLLQSTAMSQRLKEQLLSIAEPI